MGDAGWKRRMDAVLMSDVAPEVRAAVAALHPGTESISIAKIRDAASAAGAGEEDVRRVIGLIFGQRRRLEGRDTFGARRSVG